MSEGSSVPESIKKSGINRRDLLGAGGLIAAAAVASRLPSPGLNSSIQEPKTNSTQTPETTNETQQPLVVSEIHQNFLDNDLVRSGDFSSIFENLSNFRNSQKEQFDQDPNRYFIINSRSEGSDDFEKIDQDSGSTPDILDLQLTTSQDGLIIFREGPTHNKYGSKQIDVDPSLKGHRVRAVRILGDEYGSEQGLGRLTIYSNNEPYYGGAFYGLISSEQNPDGSVNNFFCDTNGNRLEENNPPICFSRTFCNPIN